MSQKTSEIPTSINWDDPAARLRLIETIGAEAYNRALQAHLDANVIEHVNGYALRAVNSCFGRLIQVVGTRQAFAKIEQAREHASGLPAAEPKA